MPQIMWTQPEKLEWKLVESWSYPTQDRIYNYRIYLIKRPGVYFRSKSLEGAFKQGGRLIQEGVYCYVSSKTLAQ